MRTLTLAALAFTSLANSTVAQELRLELVGMGSGVAAAGDIDGDGAADLLVSPPVRAFSVPSGRQLFELPYVGPRAHLFSSVAGDLDDQDGDGIDDLLLEDGSYSGGVLVAPPPQRYPNARLTYFTAPVGAGWLAGAVALDDLDGDGIGEVATGWPDVYFVRCGGDGATIVSGGSGGFVQVHSGRDGQVLHAQQGARGDALGGVLARIGDVDGDGLADIAAATRYYNQDYNFHCFNGGGNYLRILSSSTGATVWQATGAPRTIAPVGDVDRDGVADLALGFHSFGRIDLRSGRTGAFLRSFTRTSLGSKSVGIGLALAPLPDLDGDGREDLLVGAPDPIDRFGAPGPGSVLVVSSLSGKPLLKLRGERLGQEFGATLVHLGDVDGDGRHEIAVGSAGEPGGLVQVFSLPASPLLRPRPR